MRHQKNFTGRIIFMSMVNDISWGLRDTEKECESNARLVSLYARRFGAGQWFFLGFRSEKKWYSLSADSPQGEWDRMAEKMILEFGEIFFVDTKKKQNADVLTKGDELDHLLRLLNEHHDFLDVSLQPFSFEQKAKCHVKKEYPPQDSSTSNSPGNQELDQSHDVNNLDNVDFIPSHDQSSHQEALLYGLSCG